MVETQSPYLEADLNDKRLTARFNVLVHQLSNNISGTLPEVAQSKGATKGMYRFFDNKKVSPDKLIQAHVNQIDWQSSLGNTPRYLVLSDSSELDYTRKKGAAQLGPLTYKKRRGLLVHNSLVINEQGVIKGLLHQKHIIRGDKDFGKTEERRSVPIEEKESFKWLEHFKQAEQLSERENIELVYVADRESDMMELFHLPRREQMHLLIRSQFNRCLDKQSIKLYQLLEEQPSIGTYTLPVTDAKSGQTRKATIAVRFCQTTIRLSNKERRKCKKHLKPVAISAVEVYEMNPPQQVKPIRWVLLTSLPVHDFTSTMQVVRYYTLRWIIERFHYLLKSGGANIEHLQLQTPHRICNAIATYSIAVMNVMKLRYLAENEPNKSVSDAGITAQQCKILYTYVSFKKIDNKVHFDPNNLPTIWEFCRVLGKIGGFIPSKRQPLPGLKILTRAMEKFTTILEVHDALSSNDFPKDKDVGYQ